MYFKILMATVLLILITGCSSSGRLGNHYSVEVRKNLISDALWVNSRHDLPNAVQVEFCSAINHDQESRITFTFDCDFPAELVDPFLSTWISYATPILDKLQESSYFPWLRDQLWCVNIVGSGKGFHARRRVRDCIPFYVSADRIGFNIDVGFSVDEIHELRQAGVVTFLATMLHEGFHVHSYSDRTRPYQDVFINEVIAYIIEETVSIQANLLFDFDYNRWRRQSDDDSQEYLIFNCEGANQKTLEKLLQRYDDQISAIAFLAVRQLVHDINTTPDMLLLYLDFIREDLRREDADAYQFFSVIPSCNLSRARLIRALTSTFIDYDLGSLESQDFPDSEFFMQQLSYSDVSDWHSIASGYCEALNSDHFSYLVCYANYIDAFESLRGIINNHKAVLSDFPIELQGRVKHLRVEKHGGGWHPTLESSYFSFDREASYYLNYHELIADTGSAFNVNVREGVLCSEMKDDILVVAHGLMNNRRHLKFCGFHSKYGATWYADNVNAAIIGLHILVASNGVLRNAEVPTTNIIIDKPYTVQGGFPVLQVDDGKGRRINACIDSGSKNSFITNRYQRRQLEQGPFYFQRLNDPNLEMGDSEGFSKLTNDSFFHCDLILGSLFLSKFPSIMFYKDRVAFEYPKVTAISPVLLIKSDL